MKYKKFSQKNNLDIPAAPVVSAAFAATIEAKDGNPDKRQLDIINFLPANVSRLTSIELAEVVKREEKARKMAFKLAEIALLEDISSMLDKTEVGEDAVLDELRKILPHDNLLTTAQSIKDIGLHQRDSLSDITGDIDLDNLHPPLINQTDQQMIALNPTRPESDISSNEAENIARMFAG
jgi:hypothetical protein